MSVPSMQPLTIPFYIQPTNSPEILQMKSSSQPYPPSPLLPVVIPHPQPIGAGLSLHKNNPGPINLPPIATLLSTVLSPPAAGGLDNQMQVDSGGHSVSLSWSKLYPSETPLQHAMFLLTSSCHSQEKMEILT